MKIIKQYCEWIQPPPINTLEIIERAGRTCYKSEDKITSTSSVEFAKKIQGSGHSSVIEHVAASMLFVTDRGVTHEMVRHRIASYSQESTRYCNYGKDKFGNEITFILPVRLDKVDSVDEIQSNKYSHWIKSMSQCEENYLTSIKMGETPQEARDMLPNSLKTEIVMTANMREWIHFFTLRCSPKTHPQMRNLACQALEKFNKDVPVLFDSLSKQYLV